MKVDENKSQANETHQKISYAVTNTFALWQLCGYRNR
jgi:hypothetical protein